MPAKGFNAGRRHLGQHGLWKNGLGHSCGGVIIPHKPSRLQKSAVSPHRGDLTHSEAFAPWFTAAYRQPRGDVRNPARRECVRVPEIKNERLGR